MTASIGSNTTLERRHAGKVALSSTADLIGAIGKADSVSVGTYSLNRALVWALEDAAQKGAHVRVRMGRPWRDSGDLKAKNDNAINELQRAGVEVTQTSRIEHLKAAVLDERVYLDDRNWTGKDPETVVVDSRPADVAAVRKALDSGIAPPGSSSFAVGKSDASGLERDLIVSSKGTILDVQSETLTIDSRVEDALMYAAQRERVRLIVSRDGASDPKERSALEQLARNGVQIRIGDAQSGVGNEKFCVTGGRAWIGSANATFAAKDRTSLDWGLRTHAREIVDALHKAFESNWKSSDAFRLRA